MDVAAVDAPIEQVTVYASGARVRRVTTIHAPLPAQVRIVGLPLSIVDDSVRVEVGGPAVASSIRAGVSAPMVADQADDSAALLAARRRVSIAEAEAERIQGALDVLRTSPIIDADPSDEPAPPWGAVVSARRAVVALRTERELALHAQGGDAEREVEEARRGLEAVLDRELRAGSARPAKQHELRKYLEIDLVATAASEIVIHVEYLVAAARWAPSYVARIDGETVSCELRAVVAQDAGEDWSRVPLRLSTAEPDRFATLPELTAQKIGRRQADPVRTGFRAPPEGVSALYADYEHSLPTPPTQLVPEPPREEDRFEDEEITDAPAPMSPPQAQASAFSDQVWDERSSRAKKAFQTPPEGVRMAAPAPPASRGGGGPLPAPKRARRAPTGAPLSSPESATVRLDYGNLRMAPASSPLRGQLIEAPPDRHATGIARELSIAEARVADLRLPAGCVVDWPHTHDYAFATDGVVDVRADGAWHSIAVTARPSTAKLRHVAVPGEQSDVFRVAAVANPFAAPLLPGPIDVYDRGRYLVTSRLDHTPPGATVEIGLGVDPAVKVARNVEFREEAVGMLRGALRLHHAITIEVENLSGHGIDLEVRERIPVTREGDDEIEVNLGKIEPGWERWTPEPDAPRDQRLRGGHRWRLAVPAGAKRVLKATYDVKIAGKLELVGGNRRDS